MNNHLLTMIELTNDVCAMQARFIEDQLTRQEIAKMLREQGERENTYEKQDCFERAARMVEGL